MTLAYEAPRPVTAFASVVLCENPGTMELDGTNTWILRAPGAATCVVVDPGPPHHPRHAEAVAAAAGRVGTVLITHRHDDHTGGIADLVDRAAAPVRAWSPEFCRGADPLADREVLDVAGLRITVLHTPGHTADSVCLLVEHGPERVMLTGDTVLGRGTTVLDPVDGTLRDYLSSLDRLVATGGGCRLLPGHGPDRSAMLPVVLAYREHRARRLGEIRRALAALGTDAAGADPAAVTSRVYADVAPALLPAATMSVRVQLDYLAGG